MKASLIDTDILSLFFKKHPQVTATFQSYVNQFGKINLSIITYYEILSGLKYRDASKKLTVFHDFVTRNTVLTLTQDSVTYSAAVYAILRKQGTPIDDIDLLIAGIALSNNLTLVTRNKSHFNRIPNLKIDDWSITK